METRRSALRLSAGAIAASLLATTSLAGCAPKPGVGQASGPLGRFRALAADYIATRARLDPVEATGLGVHDHDGELPDISAAGRELAKREWQRLLGELGKIDRATLGAEDQVDHLLLDNELRYAIWKIDRLEQWAWNPQPYNDTASYALYHLVARDFAPWHRRMRSAIERMEKLPGFLAEMRRQIVPARVPRVHAETVAAQNAGIMEIVDAVLMPELGRLELGQRTRFDAALHGLKDAVAAHQEWLDKELVPAAQGDFRLGPELYDEKMRFALLSSMDRETLLARALAEAKAVRAEMHALSRSVLAGQGVAADDDEQQSIEAALALSYAKRPARNQLEQRARETLAQATAFVKAKGFVEMPKGEVRVITMPKFWQGNAVAYDDPPPALDPGLPNYYAVSPIPESWTDAQATSFLTEYNDYMIHDLSIHEGMPGHYLQGDFQARHGNPLRSVLASGPYVEGWAVYAEGLMADEGYLGGDPLFKLTVLKMRLRSITNTILDIGIHTRGMTRDEAMELMMQGAFQQEREAAGKWVRANLSSVQLLSYFTGYAEHVDLRKEAEARWGAAFTLRRYHEAVLAHGAPPVRLLRALMFGEAIS